ncbi:MAG: hypothetical protein ACOYMS_14405 [Terrimicrobiaceae bacterium]
MKTLPLLPLLAQVAHPDGSRFAFQQPLCLVAASEKGRALALGFWVFVRCILSRVTRELRVRGMVSLFLMVPGIGMAETPVDLSAPPKIVARGGALINVTQSADGKGTIISVEYPNAESGGNVAFKVDSFDGPLGRLAFLAKGDVGNWRIGLRGSSKSTSAPSIAFPTVSEVLQPYSLDFVSITKKAKEAEIPIQYPITEIVFGFRYKDRPKDVVELSELILHRGE